MVANSEIQEKGGNLSIPLYARLESASGIMAAEDHGVYHANNLKQAIAEWQQRATGLRQSMEDLFEMLEKGGPQITQSPADAQSSVGDKK